jgi:hypothetical protein
MEMLKASMLKYESPASYEEKLNNLPKILLLRAALDRNFLKNPKDVGEVVANTLYTNNNQNTTAMLMVSDCICSLGNTLSFYQRCTSQVH